MGNPHRTSLATELSHGLVFWIIWSLASFLLLSGLGLLGTLGYEVAAIAGLGVAISFLRQRSRRFTFRIHRLSYPPALLWYLIATLILAGSLWHSPSNYDAFAYRLPRMLHWLAGGRWHWIAGPDARYDFMAPLWEISALPLLAITRSDRLLFVPNFVCFLILPGLTFSTFRALGISRSTSRLCMWVIPTGYGFVLQAGSLGSDLMGAVLFLMSLSLLLKWSKNGNPSDFLLSCVTLGLSTLVKVSNLVFGFPWLLLLVPNWRNLLRKPVVFALSLLCGLLVSYVPMGIWNFAHGSGLAGSEESARSRSGGNPLVCGLGNTIIWSMQNFAPPAFPIASRVQGVVDGFIPPLTLERLRETFEGGFKLGVGELVTEDVAGLGLGVTGFLVLLLGIRLLSVRQTGKAPAARLQLLGAGLAGSLAVFFLKTSMISISRLLLPAYVPAASFLAWGDAVGRAARKRWLIVVACLVQISAIGVLVLNPGKPLLPVRQLASSLLPQGSPLLARAEAVYSAYAGRSTALTSVADSLPPDADVITLVCKGDTLETGLWKPFGSRKVITVQIADALNPGFHYPTRYVVVQERGVLQEASLTAKEFLLKTRLTALHTIPVIQQAKSGQENFYIAESPSTSEAPRR